MNPEFLLDVDYEKYEVIYLAITVTDLNQEVNDDSASGIVHWFGSICRIFIYLYLHIGVLTVRIEDENDNEPEFMLDTLLTARSVVEEAAKEVIIGMLCFRIYIEFYRDA